MKLILLFIRSLRIHQWVKNVFIFAPMIFALRFFQTSYIVNSVAAFLLFGFVAGSIYVFNDCFDKDKDRLHPEKKRRPIASGELPVPAAAVSAVVLLGMSMTLIYFFSTTFFYIALIYVFLNILYSSWLKKVVILDVLIIAVGFVIRVEIGGVINAIDLSPWILVITFLLATFLALIKRRQELVKVRVPDNDNIGETRKTLKKYNIGLLDQLISITTATTLISYIIYVTNPDILDKFGTARLYLTVPFVVFGVFRYLYLTYVKEKGENPAEVLFDIPFSVNALLWLAVFIFLILY